MTNNGPNALSRDAKSYCEGCLNITCIIVKTLIFSVVNESFFNEESAAKS